MANRTVKEPFTRSRVLVQSRIITCLSLSILLSQVVAASYVSVARAENASDTKNSANSEAPKAAHPIETGAEKVTLLSDRPPVLRWSPEGKPKGVVLCLHEIGMYSGVFADLGKRLSKNGYIAYAMDERGFGAWEQMKGPEAHMNLDRILLDIKDTVTEIHKKDADIPVFLLGESMGGALALKAAAMYPTLIQGTISAAPGGEHFNTSHNYLRVGQKLLTGPNKRFDMGKDFLAVASPRAELKEYMESDSMVRLDLTPKELMACQFFMYKTRDFAKQIKNVPVMIVQGQQDGQTKPESSNRVYDALATSDKKMLPLANGDHYVYEDKRVDDKAMQETLSWLDNHLAYSPAKGTTN